MEVLLRPAGTSVHPSLWPYADHVAQMMLLRWVEDHLQKNAYAPGPLVPVNLDAAGEGK